MTNAPVFFSESLEKPIDDEDKVHHELMDTLRSIEETTSRDYDYAVRAVHAKSQGVFEGELTIAPDLPPELAQGMFATPGAHRVVMRLSTQPGDLLDDAVSTGRGLAIKVFDVAGARLPEAAGETTQNLLLASGPAFSAPNAAKFLGTLKQLASTTDKAEWAKKLLSATLRGVEDVLEAVGTKSTFVQGMSGVPITHPLGDAYYSQTAFRFGEYVAKFGLFPVSENLTSLHGDRVNVTDRPDALREVVRDTIFELGGAWELRVQLCTDIETMPIEDASVVWDEKASPYRTVARIVVPSQITMGTELQAQADDSSFFSPWHGLAAHQPLGSVNRARRQTYEASAQFRGRFNGCPMHDSQALAAAMAQRDSAAPAIPAV